MQLPSADIFNRLTTRVTYKLMYNVPFQPYCKNSGVFLDMIIAVVTGREGGQSWGPVATPQTAGREGGRPAILHS